MPDEIFHLDVADGSFGPARFFCQIALIAYANDAIIIVVNERSSPRWSVVEPSRRHPRRLGRAPTYPSRILPHFLLFVARLLPLKLFLCNHSLMSYLCCIAHPGRNAGGSGGGSPGGASLRNRNVVPKSTTLIASLHSVAALPQTPSLVTVVAEWRQRLCHTDCVRNQRIPWQKLLVIVVVIYWSTDRKMTRTR